MRRNLQHFLMLFSLSMLVVCGLISARGFAQTAEEASGITRLGDDLIMVSDEVPGAYYRFRLSKGEGPEIQIDPGRAERIDLARANLAVDLEAVDVLTDGRIVVLSERLHSLVSENGIVAEYDQPLSEFGNRGLEGLAVRRLKDGSSRIAVLWEGGYPDYKDVPMQLQKDVGRVPMRPVVWMHDLRKGEAGIEIKMKKKEEYALSIIELDLPKPEGLEPQAQRFRAPDLVWHKHGNKEWGFIVLLSSQNSPETGEPEYVHQWLQRFTVAGAPLGDPIDLNAVLPAHLKGANWEGLGWFEEGKSLVVIHDKPPKGSPTEKHKGGRVLNCEYCWK